MHLVGEIVVQKFGGAALASIDAMRHAAQIVANAHAAGRVPCVVVSAMGATTDELIAMARRCADVIPPRELDALLACGESMSAPLFATCLRGMGIAAVSLSGSQAGIQTTADHGAAAVAQVNADRIQALLADGHVPVVAGFQGFAPNGDTTTLGRGGSDLTAVVLGAALGARIVELYKDVDGIYDRDPTEHDEAVLHGRLDYDALLSLIAGGGHAVLQAQAVQHAKTHRVALRVVPFRQAATDASASGTLVKNVTAAPPWRASQLPAAMATGLPVRHPTAPRMEAVRVASAADAASLPGRGTTVFEERESNIRGYCRSFPAVFQRAKGACMFDEAGRRYLDFFSGAGALNYGHNPDGIREKMIDYLQKDGISHALDMYTTAKRGFLETFRDVILAPRGLDYKVQFCGPTGANSVEAALKLARLATGRTTIASFSGGWHGMTAAALAICGNRENREAAGAPLPFTTVFPFADGPYRLDDSLGYIDSLFTDPNSGLDTPAALILETVQGEGGIYVAPPEWLRGVRALCDRHGVLMIVDDIQVGCGRTGSFFSFERAGIVPDIVCIAKSIGGNGQPMSLLLMRPEVDVWKPGQHTGTFRGNQLGFVAATAALDQYWRTGAFTDGIAERARLMRKWLDERIAPIARGATVRGVGMMWGLDLGAAGGPALAREIGRLSFESGLVIERCGRDDTVMKLMPPLTIGVDELAEGLRILMAATSAAVGAAGEQRSSVGVA